MTLDEIETLALRMRAQGLDELEYSSGGTSIVLRSRAVAEIPPPPRKLAKAPMFGHFLPIHPQRQAPEVMPGDAVEAGQFLGFVDAGGVLHPVTAPVAAVVGRILPEAGALVGYGEAIVELD